MLPWLESSNDTFVVGFEANPALAALFDAFSGSSLGIDVFPASQGSADCTPPLSKRFGRVMHRGLVVHAAIADTDHMHIPFYGGGDTVTKKGGAAHTDVGSVLEWKDAADHRAGQQQDVRLVPTVRLKTILERLPPPPELIWDTLKVDIQGYDVEALYSAGELLQNFVCIVGEFGGFAYKVPPGVRMDMRVPLRRAGFIPLSTVDGRSSYGNWINPRFRTQYLAAPEEFHCHRVYDGPRGVHGFVRALQRNHSIEPTPLRNGDNIFSQKYEAAVLQQKGRGKRAAE